MDAVSRCATHRGIRLHPQACLLRGGSRATAGRGSIPSSAEPQQPTTYNENITVRTRRVDSSPLFLLWKPPLSRRRSVLRDCVLRAGPALSFGERYVLRDLSVLCVDVSSPRLDCPEMERDAKPVEGSGVLVRHARCWAVSAPRLGRRPDLSHEQARRNRPQRSLELREDEHRSCASAAQLGSDASCVARRVHRHVRLDVGAGRSYAQGMPPGRGGELSLGPGDLGIRSVSGGRRPCFRAACLV